MGLARRCGCRWPALGRHGLRAASETCPDSGAGKLIGGDGGLVRSGTAADSRKHAAGRAGARGGLREGGATLGSDACRTDAAIHKPASGASLRNLGSGWTDHLDGRRRCCSRRGSRGRLGAGAASCPGGRGSSRRIPAGSALRPRQHSGCSVRGRALFELSGPAGRLRPSHRRRRGTRYSNVTIRLSFKGFVSVVPGSGTTTALIVSPSSNRSA